MKDRRYEFSTVWRLDAPVEDTWDFLTAPEQRWRDWWRHLESIRVERAPHLVGSVAQCAWRSPLGYRLGFTVELTRMIPGRQVTLAVVGDLAGAGAIDVLPDHRGGRERRRSLLHVRWHVRTCRRWMNVAGLVLEPLFRYGHDVVMRHGERGLNHALRPACQGEPESAGVGERLQDSGPWAARPVEAISVR